MDTRTELTIQVAKLREQLQLLEAERSVDLLTTVKSRRFMVDRMTQEVTQPRSCSILLIDLDRFKTINDTYGHATGDAVLKRVAQTLAWNVRTSDEVGRWGGEEFLVLCPDTDEMDAAALAERLRNSVEVLTWLFEQRVTISIGVASRGPKATRPIDTTIANADTAMYAAKHAGRNRVVTHWNLRWKAFISGKLRNPT